MEPIEVLDVPFNRYINVAGIIPIAGYQNEYNTILPDYLHPLAVDYYPIHKSVMECAFAGCDTIWVVCNYDYMRMVKNFIGDSIIDPITYERFYFNKHGKKIYKRKRIPIMYIAMDMKYLKYCSIPFSILYGAYMVKRVSNKISKWAKPEKYFVSFMNQQYDINGLYDVRKNIASPNPFFVSHNGKTVLDNETSAFTFDYKDLYQILKWSKIKNNISLQDAFQKMKTEDSYVWEPKYCFNTKTWEGLREYMGSPFTEKHKVIPSIFTDFKFKPLYRERKEKNGNV